MKRLFYSTFAILFSIFLLSCDTNDIITGGNNDNIKDNYTVDSNIASLSSELFNTSWTYIRTNHYESNGSFLHSSYGPSINRTYTFTDDIYSDNRYVLLVNGLSGSTYWYIDNYGLRCYAIGYAYDTDMSSSDIGGWVVSGGNISSGKITKHTRSELIIKVDQGSRYVEHIFKVY